MHEIEIIKNVLSIAIEYGNQEDAKQIQQIEIKVGKATNILPEALQLAFDYVKRGTIAEDASLEINYLPTIYYCLDCCLDFQPTDHLNECPRCQKSSTDLRQGSELCISSLKIS